MLAHCGEGDTAVAGYVNAAVAPVRHQEIFSHADVFIEVEVGVHARAVTAVKCLLDVTVLVDIVKGEEHGAFFAAVGDGGGQVVGPGCAVHFVLPVGVCSGIIGVPVHELLEYRCLAVAVKYVRGSDTGIAASGPICLAPLVGVQHIIPLGNGLCAQGVVHVYGEAVALALLCGNDNDTVGGA